ncbi:MAG: outer membrane beta-barrel protein [Bacteroidales bacterium]|nr:outer membrane beta-barrel protein [Bacteroidales bacterium]
MSNQDWTDKLPELLEGYTEVEPEGLWDAVQAGVEPKKRRIAAWWYAGGALLAAAAVVAAVVLLWPVTPSADVTLVPGNVVAEVSDSLDTSSTAGGEVLPSSARLASQTPPSRAGSLPLQSRGAMAPEGSTSPSTETMVVPIENENTSEPIESTETKLTEESKEAVEPKEPAETAEPVKVEPAKPIETDPFAETKPEKPRRKRPATRVQVGISTTGYLGQAATSTQNGVGIPSNPGMRTLTKASSSGQYFSPSMFSRNKASTTETDHYQNSRIALGLRFNFDYRWGIETGLVSSTLTSNFDTTVGNSRSVTERSITYAGIPLYLCYNAFEWKRFSLYLSAGPMYEFSTSTNTSQKESNGFNQLKSNDDHSLYKDDKWSLNANVGLQLGIFSRSAIFVQPGWSYHFKDNSSLETFYTEHPSAFNFTFGYRILF